MKRLIATSIVVFYWLIVILAFSSCSGLGNSSTDKEMGVRQIIIDGRKFYIYLGSDGHDYFSPYDSRPCNGYPTYHYPDCIKCANK